MKHNFLTTILVKAAFSLSGVLLLGSCVAENMDPCLLPLLIRTDHERMLATGPGLVNGRTTGTPIENWYTDIGDVNVYFFDENNHFVMRWTGGSYTLGEEYEVPISQLGLPQGVYNLVAWTNHGDNYELYNSNAADMHGNNRHFDDFRMIMTMPESREFLEDFAHRHHGTLMHVNLSGNSIRTEPYVIEVVPTTHKLNFTINFSEALGYTGEDRFDLVITDRNVSHTFDNEFVDGHHPYRHVRAMAAVESGVEPESETRTEEERYITGLSASATVMQINDETGTTFEVKNRETGQTVYPPIDLVRVIRMAASASGDSVDFDYTREFDIEVDIISDTNFIFHINDWTYVYNKVKP